MNLSKINESDFAGAELVYLKDVAKRLGAIFSEPLSHLETIALMQIITQYTFHFDDGFVLNDMVDDNRMVGISGAAAVAAAFCRDHPEKNWLWWKGEYPRVDTQSRDFEAVHGSLLSAIVKHPRVRKTMR